MKIFKRILLAMAILLVLALISAAIAYRQLRKAPQFYRQFQWTMEQRSLLNQQAVNKWTAVQNDASRSTAGQATRPGNVHDLSFTEEEVNAFLVHNAETFRQKYDRYIASPGIYFENNRVILAAEVKEFGYVVSAHFEPKIDDQGQLRMTLVKTLGGSLPVPRSVIQQRLEKLRNELKSKLPEYQRGAAIDSYGRANNDALQATFGKLLLAALEDRAADPLLLVPIAESGKSVPYRLTGLQIDEDAIHVRLEPTARDQRQQILAAIRRAPSAK